MGASVLYTRLITSSQSECESKLWQALKCDAVAHEWSGHLQKYCRLLLVQEVFFLKKRRIQYTYYHWLLHWQDKPNCACVRRQTERPLSSPCGIFEPRGSKIWHNTGKLGLLCYALVMETLFDCPCHASVSFSGWIGRRTRLRDLVWRSRRWWDTLAFPHWRVIIPSCWQRFWSSLSKSPTGWSSVYSCSLLRPEYFDHAITQFNGYGLV